MDSEKVFEIDRPSEIVFKLDSTSNILPFCRISLKKSDISSLVSGADKILLLRVKYVRDYTQKSTIST